MPRPNKRLHNNYSIMDNPPEISRKSNRKKARKRMKNIEAKRKLVAMLSQAVSIEVGFSEDMLNLHNPVIETQHICI